MPLVWRILIIFTKNVYTPSAILGLSIGYNNIMSLGVSYKPGILRSSTGIHNSRKNIRELWIRSPQCSTYVQELQEDTPVLGNLNFLTITSSNQNMTWNFNQKLLVNKYEYTGVLPSSCDELKAGKYFQPTRALTTTEWPASTVALTRFRKVKVNSSSYPARPHKALLK